MLAERVNVHCLNAGTVTANGQLLSLSRDGREIYYITLAITVKDGEIERTEVNLYSTWILPAPVSFPGQRDVLHYLTEDLEEKVRQGC